MIDEIIERYGDHTEVGLLFVDGFNDAILGVCPNSLKLIYSRTKVINILMDDMSEEDAMEHAEFNIFNSYVGDQTPIFIDDIVDCK
jgi:hypothetical protein|tara:strand:+ start:397 stop:654 length:258 start_codon:yes stop_codon:yes gene_type:complete